MRKKIIFFALCCLFSFSIKVNSQWVHEFSLDQFEHINYLCVVDTFSVWGIGEIGIMHDTTAVFKLNGYYGLWKKLPLQSFMYESKMSCIAATDTLRAWVGTYDGEIFATSDGGYSWNKIFSSGGSGFINDIKFSKTNKLIGYANCDPPGGVGTPFKVLKTVNGGLNWTTYSPLYTGNYVGMSNSSCVTDSNHYWMGLNCQNYACGIPRILLTTNGGLNWVSRAISHPADYVIPLEFSSGNNNIGLCSSNGVYGTVYLHKSNDGGYSWSNYYEVQIEQMQMINSMNWIEGTSTWYFSTTSSQYTPIFKSTNNGVNWNAMYINNNGDQIDATGFKRNGNRVWGYASTINGKIFLLAQDSVSTVSINKVENTTPDKFSLSQNYPNPFNPTTNIKYQVPKNSFVILKVFDLLGKEVAVLVNERQTPGTYEVKFDGTNLPSGVYHYRVTTENYSKTRRMVLLK